MTQQSLILRAHLICLDFSLLAVPLSTKPAAELGIEQVVLVIERDWWCH